MVTRHETYGAYPLLLKVVFPHRTVGNILDQDVCLDGSFDSGCDLEEGIHVVDESKKMFGRLPR